MTGNSTSQSPTRTAEQEQAAYRLGRVVVTPASADEPAAYQHSDLRRGRTRWVLRYPFDLSYWLLYLCLLFPVQYLYQALRWRFWDDSPVALKLRVLLTEVFDNGLKLGYLLNGDRRRLYLLASRLYTPSQLFPFLPGLAPEPVDSSAESPPYPRNWDSIRKQVYERDGYRCVNCR